MAFKSGTMRHLLYKVLGGGALIVRALSKIVCWTSARGWPPKIDKDILRITFSRALSANFHMHDERLIGNFAADLLEKRSYFRSDPSAKGGIFVNLTQNYFVVNEIAPSRAKSGARISGSVIFMTRMFFTNRYVEHYQSISIQSTNTNWKLINRYVHNWA